MSDPTKQISYLAAALKPPRIPDAATRLAAQAKDSGWTHEDYLIAVLDREVAARNASGAQLRIRAAGFPARKTSTSSTSTTSQESAATTSRRWPPPTTSPRPVTWYFSDRPAPAKPMWRSPSASPPATPDSACCSPPPPTGWPVSKTLTNETGLLLNSPNSAATH